ncbi:MAG: GGDEF domain-containing protein [Kangiellaceae bacterium]|nr:GGDEF domain-containing protein [Kangiellaceae bacterium]
MLNKPKGKYCFNWLRILAGLALLLALPINAAQLVDSLPAQLELNWKQCSHFDSRLSDCQTTKLPLGNNKQESSIIFQTFTKEFVLSSELKRTTIGLWISNIDDVDEVYINNQLVGKTGGFLPSFDSGFRYPRLYLIPSEVLLFNQFNQIKIKTFSSRNLPGIQSEAPVIGDYVHFQHKLQEKDYIFVICASVFLILIIFQVFYFVVVRDSNEPIYFSMFLVAFALVTVARSQLPLEFGLELSSAFKLEMFMLNFGLISISLFIFNFFELEVRRIYVAGLATLGILGLVIIIWPFSLSLRLIAEINYWLLSVICFFVIGSALIIGLHKQRKYAWLISATCLAGWLILSFDAMMHSPGLFKLELTLRNWLVPVTAVVIGVIYSLTLTHKYWRFFKGSTYDHLTGTLLRPAFFQRLSEEMQRSMRGNDQLLIAVIDIQQAKKISATYGYSLGNHLLSTVSNALTKVLRPFDLICRFSDEQFCVAASIVSRPDAESCLKRVYQELITIEQPLDKNVELYVDARIGGVIYNPDQHLSVSHLLQDANFALSKAKSQSKNNYLLIQNPTVTA